MGAQKHSSSILQQAVVEFLSSDLNLFDGSDMGIAFGGTGVDHDPVFQAVSRLTLYNYLLRTKLKLIDIDVTFEEACGHKNVQPIGIDTIIDELLTNNHVIDVDKYIHVFAAIEAAHARLPPTGGH